MGQGKTKAQIIDSHNIIVWSLILFVSTLWGFGIVKIIMYAIKILKT